MHVFKPHRDAIAQAFRSHSPLITLPYTSRTYLLHLLSALLEDNTLGAVEVFEEGVGLSRLTKRQRLNKKSAPEREASAYLARYIEELDIDELSGGDLSESETRCLCLLIPAEVVSRSEFEAALSALCTRLAMQHSLSILISISAPLSESLSEWVSAVELSTPRRDEEGLSYLEELLCTRHEQLSVQGERERRRVTERLMTRVQGLDAAGLYVAVTEAHERVMNVDAPRDLTAWEEGMMRALLKVKTTRLKRSVGLELQPLEGFSSDELAGMARYKRYLDYMSALFQHSEDRDRLKIAPPKGVLLVGLPGCGKSLAAKLTASRLNLPLLRLELDAIMGRYLGESEHNLIRALETAEAAAPCVLWIDELDKALSGLSGDTGGGTGQRLLGRLLTWMQEQTAGVYLFATANRVGHLPPELLRRGRFDELWKVMLPDENERAAILKQKLRSRGQQWDDSDIGSGVKLTKGFTGADIEALVREAQIRAFCIAQDEISFALFKETNSSFTPLSKQFEEVIKRESEALDKHGFRDVSGQSDLPPEVSLERRALSSSELKRLRNLERPLRFHFGSDSETGWTLQIDQEAKGWAALGWIAKEEGPISAHDLMLTESQRGLSLSPHFEFGQERIEQLISEGGHLIGMSLSGLRIREKNRFEFAPQYQAGDVILSRVSGADFKLVYCPAGQFTMGDDELGHQVSITQPFLIGQTPVTQSQWKAVMKNKPSHFNGSTRPVEQVTWFDCILFCNTLSLAEGLEPVYNINSSDQNSISLYSNRTGYRLPTEAEWEYMARAGTRSKYSGSNVIKEVAWYNSNSTTSHSVSEKLPNRWGIYDCSGNIFEWCNDQWDSAAYHSRIGVTYDPHEWVDGASKNIRRSRRGGSWCSNPKACQVTYREGRQSNYKMHDLGFRLVRSC